MIVDRARLELIGNKQGPIQFPPLPRDEMLMLDRVTDISIPENRKGHIAAELDLHPDTWFFRCHFVDDPIMPGSLGLDGLCQVMGFYLGYCGYKGSGRALGIRSVKYLNEITPNHDLLRYKVHIKKVHKSDEMVVGIGDGRIDVDGSPAITASGLMVCIKYLRSH